ncbi:hypothetical protein E2C01_034362 [Portunus trituberculatus]|uniref:Uncharacterized protein n=1 Tax=Portunus trituberculatus TaxID=210409 RepID=A0A5B7F8C1_PORTR|nr:hypothetical protein [Portunus trituberculatus]
MEGNTARRASSLAKPALTVQETLSTTGRLTSSSHMTHDEIVVSDPKEIFKIVPKSRTVSRCSSGSCMSSGKNNNVSKTLCSLLYTQFIHQIPDEHARNYVK